MDRESRKLKKHFEKRLEYDEMKARKRAGKLRRAFRKDKGDVREQRVTEDNWEELLDQHGHARKRPSLSELMAHVEQDAGDAGDVVEEGERERAAIVISV